MKILEVKHWKLFAFLFGPGFITIAVSQNLLENHFSLLLGLFIALIILPILFYHLMVGKELRKLLQYKTSLNYSIVIFCVAINLLAQVMSLNWDLLNNNFLVILLMNFGSYTYIILFTLRNTYLLESKLGIVSTTRVYLFDFISIWTLPFGIWLLQNRLNKIKKMPSSNIA